MGGAHVHEPKRSKNDAFGDYSLSQSGFDSSKGSASMPPPEFKTSSSEPIGIMSEASETDGIEGHQPGAIQAKKGPRNLSGSGRVEFHIKKYWLIPTGNDSGLYAYKAGAESQGNTVEKGRKDFEAHEKKRDEYVKFKNLSGYEEELKRLKGLQQKRDKELNKRLIQETMFNSMDDDIVKWVNHYHSTIGKQNNWTKVDANLVKSMVFQESQMGTVGDFLVDPPRHQDDRMTRFNVMQAIDSSGPQQILMIQEISPEIASKHKLSDINGKVFQAKKDRTDFLKKEKAGTISSTEKATLDRINKVTGNGKYWNNYYTNLPEWRRAVNEFFGEVSPRRNMDYSYWIRTGVRWLYEKRKKTKSWEEAVRRYNGGGSKATNYKNDVVTRRNKAKATDQAGTNFIPKAGC